MRKQYLLLSLWIVFLSHNCAEELCETETFEAACSRDRAVLITDARFGRMRKNKCVQRFDNYGCGNDVITRLDRHCSGLGECSVVVGVTTMMPAGVTNLSCPHELRGYLSVRYVCVQVAVPQSCPLMGDPLQFTASEGWIPNNIQDSLSCDVSSSHPPWLVQARPGQRINLTLYDFTVDESRESAHAHRATCKVYFTVKEEGRNTQTPCGGRQRNVHVYYSNRNEVEIRMIPGQQQRGRYIIHYKIFGCPDISPPQFGWIKRTETSAIIGCDYVIDTWHLTCVNNTWTGSRGNCSRSTATTSRAGTQSADGGSSSNSILSFINNSQGTAILIISVIAVSVGAVILGLGLCFMKMTRPSPQEAAKHYESSLPPEDARYQFMKAVPVPPPPQSKSRPDLTRLDSETLPYYEFDPTQFQAPAPRSDNMPRSHLT